MDDLWSMKHWSFLNPLMESLYRIVLLALTCLLWVDTEAYHRGISGQGEIAILAHPKRALIYEWFFVLFMYLHRYGWLNATN